MLAAKVAQVTNNEGKSCDAVLRILEERLGFLRTDVSFPEQDGSGPPVELQCRIGAQKFALEHTIIEAFSGQIESSIHFGRLVESIEDELSSQLPRSGVYYLTFPIAPHKQIQGSDYGAIRSALTEWVIDQAREMYQAHPLCLARDIEPNGHRSSSTDRPPGVPFEVTLAREVHWATANEYNGRLFIVRVGPSDLESERRSRVVRALDKKCQKLRACQKMGLSTVLVLESDDVALTNHILVAKALEGAAVGRTDVPDEIYFVGTQVEPWTVWTLKLGGTFLPDEPYSVFDPLTLVNLTGRI